MSQNGFVLAILFLVPSLLSAQDDSIVPRRIIGSIADSITGGPPSVMIRYIEDVDRKGKHRNLLFIDPAKTLAFFNLSYYRGVGSEIAVGGGLQVAPGLFGSQLETNDLDESNGWGMQIGAKFFAGRGELMGFHIDPTLYLYSVEYKGRKQTPISFIMDIGYQSRVLGGFMDVKLGYERYLISLKDGSGTGYGKTSDDGMVMVGSENQIGALHFTVQTGWKW